MRPILITILFFSISGAFSQLNMTEIGFLDIPEMRDTRLNDIWGYTDEMGNEYALVGTEDGVSVVDITDGSSPEEVFWAPGLNSTWRDLKTFGDYAYITTEALQGLMIIDLSPLPASTDLTVTIYNGPEDDEWESAHNIYQIGGYVYIFGAGRDNGGVIILDVATDPLNPIEVGVFDNWYVHDGYVQDDIGYFAHIFEGFFSVVDLSDKTSPVLLGTAFTPTTFAHNIWASEDGNFVFTTDEVSGAFVGAFDVSDPTSIVEVDKIQSSPGAGIIPHNTHVKGNYLYTSYYTDGVVIHDITHPHNMVEVANFDTSPFTSGTFNGCWGAFPFFESGKVLGTDREQGLFILDADEHQGSYLEGNITESGTGFALNNVEITIDGEDITELSAITGDYATGIEGEGTLDVTYFKVLYFPQTIPVEFENGVIAMQDVVLERIPEFSVEIEVIDAETLEPIEGANVLLEHTFTSHEGLTNTDGEVTLDLFYQDNYELIVGKWGYQTKCYVDTMITDETGTIVVMLEQGIMDDFTFDYGWTATSTAARGDWEREKPVGVVGGSGLVQNPFADVDFDCGDFAFLTGNGTSSSNTEEVNDGEVVLISPTFDLTDFVNPFINYSTWFFDFHGATPDDTLKIYLMNGLGDVVLIDQRYTEEFPPISEWRASSIEILGLMEITENMQLMITLSDFLETENVTEGGLDNFSVTDFDISGIDDAEEKPLISLYPNPFSSTLTIDGIEEGWITVLDLSGRVITEIPIQKQIEIGDMERGTYFFVISDVNRNKVQVVTQVKN